MPAAIRARAGNLFIGAQFHRFRLRERRLGASALKVDSVSALWAQEFDSIGFAHTL